MLMSMGDDTVLVIGQRPDPHIDVVIGHLSELNAKIFLLDRYDRDQAISLVYPSTGSWQGWTRSAGLEIPLDELTSIWWRVKPFRQVDFAYQQDQMEEAFGTREWLEVLRSLFKLLDHAFWVNPVDSNVTAGRKPWQLALALKVGLECPETIISNNSSDILNQTASVDKVIFKTLSSFVRPPNEIVFTNEVSKNLIQESSDQIAVAPGIYQHKLDKRHELRVTIVGEHVFCVGIDSQSDQSTQTDWRRNQSRKMYFNADLSAETENKLLMFHQAAGLLFATYDFIVTPDGREIFLECNPGGQWLWLEQCLGLGISRCLAELLVEPGREAN